MSITVRGVEYVGTREVCQRLAPDVTPETLRNWYHPRNGAEPLLHPLAGSDGRPVLLDGEYLFAWPEVTTAERGPRVGGVGRRRAGRAAVPPGFSRSGDNTPTNRA